MRLVELKIVLYTQKNTFMNGVIRYVENEEKWRERQVTVTGYFFV